MANNNTTKHNKQSSHNPTLPTTDYYYTKLQSMNWKGMIPVIVTLSETSLSSPTRPPPIHVLVPRHSYLHIGLYHAICRLSKYAVTSPTRLLSQNNGVVVDGQQQGGGDDDEEEEEEENGNDFLINTWFEDEISNAPLRWHLFVGVLYDMHRLKRLQQQQQQRQQQQFGEIGNGPVTNALHVLSHPAACNMHQNGVGDECFPWRIRLHFTSYPFNQILPLYDKSVLTVTTSPTATSKKLFRNNTGNNNTNGNVDASSKDKELTGENQAKGIVHVGEEKEDVALDKNNRGNDFDKVDEQCDIDRSGGNAKTKQSKDSRTVNEECNSALKGSTATDSVSTPPTKNKVVTSNTTQPSLTRIRTSQSRTISRTITVPESIQQYYFNSLKQSLYLQYNTAKISQSRLTKQVHTQLWDALLRQQPQQQLATHNNYSYEMYRIANCDLQAMFCNLDSKVYSSSREKGDSISGGGGSEDRSSPQSSVPYNVPVRVLVDGRPPIQRPSSAYRRLFKSELTTIGDLLSEWLPHLFYRAQQSDGAERGGDADESVISRSGEKLTPNDESPCLWQQNGNTKGSIQGIVPPLSCPIVELWQGMCHPDHFLYVVVATSP